MAEQTSPPEPRKGLLIFDPEFPHDRWQVQGSNSDGMITAKRMNPADGITTNWTPSSWAFAWERGYLKEARR